MNKIIQMIADGTLTKETDATGSGGFWDLAGELAKVGVPDVEPHEYMDEYQMRQMEIFEALWGLYNELTQFV